MTGGGARFAYWGQLLAAALNRPLTYRAGSEVGAALGAARLARLALTGESPQLVCTLPPITHVVEPDPRWRHCWPIAAASLRGCIGISKILSWSLQHEPVFNH